MDLGKKLEIWIFQRGGVICNFGFGLREKVGNLDFPEGGVICNFGFGLREKVGILDIPGGGYSVNVMEKEKKQNNIKILLLPKAEDNLST